MGNTHKVLTETTLVTKTDSNTNCTPNLGDAELEADLNTDLSRLNTLVTSRCLVHDAGKKGIHIMKEENTTHRRVLTRHNLSHMVLLQHGHVLIGDHFYFVILLSCTQHMVVLSFNTAVFLWVVSRHERASNRLGRVLFRAVYHFNYFSCILKLLIAIF